MSKVVIKYNSRAVSEMEGGVGVGSSRVEAEVTS